MVEPTCVLIKQLKDKGREMSTILEKIQEQILEMCDGV
jgi:hypothetical protein